MAGILDGVKVLGLEQQVAGPYCTMMLADQGAEVIKVERPGTGDTGREMAPYLKGPDGKVQSGYFARFNRGKKSVTVNMSSKCKEGLDVLWALVKDADIIVDNLKPGYMDKLGFTYEEIKKVNPKVIYVGISGFGRSKKFEGPYASRLAYDIIVQAMSGQMYTCGGDADGPPTWLGFALADAGTGVFAAYAALLGYINRLRNDEGEFIDVSMFDCMMALAERSHNVYAFTGNVVNRGPDKLIAPWGPFKCKDGHVALIVPTEAMWKKFCTAIGHTELCDKEQNPDIQSGPGRGAHMETLIRPIINEWLSTRTMEEACNAFMAEGLPCGPIQNAKQVAEDEHTKKRQMIVELPDPIIGSIKMVGCPLKMDDKDPCYGPLPNLGADTDATLKRLGYTDEQIANLHEIGAL